MTYLAPPPRHVTQRLYLLLRPITLSKHSSGFARSGIRAHASIASDSVAGGSAIGAPRPEINRGYSLLRGIRALAPFHGTLSVGRHINALTTSGVHASGRTRSQLRDPGADFAKTAQA